MGTPRAERLAKVTRGEPITPSGERVARRSNKFIDRAGFPSSAWKLDTVQTRAGTVPALAIHAPPHIRDIQALTQGS